MISPDKEDIIEHYVNRCLSISALARFYGVSQPTARKWLIEYEIPRKDQKQASRETNAAKKQIMPDLTVFCEDFKNLSIDQMELKYSTGQSTIYEWKTWAGIESNKHSECCERGKQRQFKHIQFTKDEVQEAYDASSKNLQIAADTLGVSYSHMRKLCKRHNITIYNPKRSKAEHAIYELCVSMAPNERWIIGSRQVIYPLELDIYNEDRKLAIEVCGSYWHSETLGEKSRSYHKDKYDMCYEKGIKLITVFEFDEAHKIKELLMSVIGNLPLTLNARDMNVVPIQASIARTFLDQHHLSGFIGASTHLGLVDKKTDELMMIASFSGARNKAYDFECMRMASRGDCRVRGGASKLFSHFIKQMDVGKTLITYADLRFGDGSTYIHCGMQRQKNTPPNYWYFHKNTPHIKHSRVAFQKHKLKSLLPIYDDAIAEYANMLKNGYDRIWDCGNAVYTMKKGE